MNRVGESAFESIMIGGRFVKDVAKAWTNVQVDVPGGWLNALQSSRGTRDQNSPVGSPLPDGWIETECLSRSAHSR